MSDIQVIKRNGTTEVFTAEKIARVTQAAGLEPDQAEKLASDITGWVKSLPDKTVTSLQIRDRVIEGLKHVDLMAANMYQWYDQTKK